MLFDETGMLIEKETKELSADEYLKIKEFDLSLCKITHINTIEESLISRNQN